VADLLRVRTVLRASLEAIAPLLFGYVSTLFGARTGGLGNPTGDAGPGGSGLDATFLIMLLPLTVAGPACSSCSAPAAPTPATSPPPPNATPASTPPPTPGAVPGADKATETSG